jgi:histidinol-phosphate aminotransferase
MSRSDWPQWLPLKDDLRDMTAYGAPQIGSVIRMNTNENPYGPSLALAQDLSARVLVIAQELNRYPDRDARELRMELAKYLNSLSGCDLSADEIWAANGSNEIIQTLFLAFGSGSALGFVPSYSMHALIAKVTGTPWIEGKRNPDFSLNESVAIEEVKQHRPALTFITTPNNPTGSAVSLATITNLAHACREVGGLLLVDEAYAEFSSLKSAITLVDNFPNVIVIRTLSKAFAFAGARIGYMAAHPDVVKAVQLVRLPYHLSHITQAVGLVGLEHQQDLLENVRKLVAARDLMAKDLAALGCQVVPSEANFILFTVPNSKLIWDSLLEQGVLIRDVGLSGYLRVTIGTTEENQRFIEALRSALSPGGGTR